MKIGINTRHAVVAATASLALALLATGCGSSDDSASAGGGGGAAGASSAAASKKPITLGLASIDSMAAYKGLSEAAEVAVKYINAEKGGIDGHPVKLVNCDTKGEEAASQACGQQFANDPSIPAVLGPFDLAMGKVQGALSGKPLFLGIPVTPDQENMPNTYGYITSSSGTFAAYADYVLNTLHAKSVSFIHEDDAAMNGAGQVMKGIFAKAGVSYKETVVPASATDVLPQVQASGANKADATIMMGPENCNIYADAFKSLGWKPKGLVSGSACIGTPMVQDYAKFVGWTDLSPFEMASAPAGEPDVQEMLAAWKKYATSKAPGALGEVGWATVINFKRAIEAAHPATLDSKSIAAALKSYTGPIDIGGGNADCASNGPVVCTKPRVTGYDLTPSGLKLHQS